MRIDSYQFGEIVVDGRRYASDILILPGRIIEWRRQTGHQVRLTDLEEVAPAKPEILIFGTGEPGQMKVLPEVEKYFREQNVELIVKPTKEAIQDYNRLSAKRKVAAGFHLTC